VIVIATGIPGVKLLEPEMFRDERGFFMESFNRARLLSAGLPAEFVQDNHSGSFKNVLRGLHYQVRQAQGKLVRVVAGEVLDVAVDVRRESETFGQHVTAILSAENRRMIWIPPGFAHGFVVRSDFAEVLYKATAYYDRDAERAILWNDPDLAIDWQLSSAPLLSPKDSLAPRLKDAELPASVLPHPRAT
jgi:dTDP-4-dehydrorhamnose 3,5-epimerase